MVITRIERLRGKKARYAISLDGKRAVDISEAVLVKFRLATDDEIDEVLLRRMAAEDAEASAKDIAINYLSYRPRSVKEILDHLHRKKIPPEVARGVAERLEQLRLLNDLEFARMFVRDRMSRKRSGAMMLRQQLSAKGISGGIIDQVFSESVTEDALAEACLLLARKRLERSTTAFSRLDMPHRRQRLLEFLLRRGFGFELAQRTVRLLLS